MKNVTPQLLALLASRQFYYATLFTFTLRGGTVLRYTDGDVDISAGGETFAAGGQDGVLVNAGDNRVTITWHIGLQVDTVTFDVLPRAGTVGGVPWLQALRNGVFDGAEVKIEYAFMPTYGDTSVGTVVAFTGLVAEVTADRARATFEVNSHLELLDKNMPRNLFQPGCTNTLFDSGCALLKAAYSVNSAVTTGATINSIRASVNLGSTTAGYYALGVVTFTSGANAGFSRTVKIHTKAGSISTFTLLSPLPAVPAQGDTFTIYPGCDKTKATCQAKFNNLANFRGYPYVPVNETAV